MHVKVLVKLALLFKNENTKKKLSKILIVILSPFILIITMLFTTVHAVSEHNNQVIQTVFEQLPIPDTVPKDYKMYIESMQRNFIVLDKYINEIQMKVKEGSLDPMQIKALFFNNYFGESDNKISDNTIKEFVECFVFYEERIIKPNKVEDPVKTEIVAVIIGDIQKVIKNVSSVIGRKISAEQIKNFEKIYSMVNHGSSASTAGDGGYMKDLLKDAIKSAEKKPYVGGRPESPFKDDWRNKITSEFGRRDEIVLPDGSVTLSGHTGMDLGNGTPMGTPILAVNDGEIVYVRNHKVGLGLHLAISHGGGIITVYGHTSRIIVKEGDKVKKGQKIAEVGSTGWSTGPHLHLEYWVHGEVKNPREYLE